MNSQEEVSDTLGEEQSGEIENDKLVLTLLLEEPLLLVRMNSQLEQKYP